MLPNFREPPRLAGPALLLLAPLALLAPLLVVAPAALAAQERPRPYPVTPPEGYRAAVEAGTRTAEGAPGPDYWQQWAEYDVEVRLLTGSRRLLGSETITYHNRSPDTLETLHLHLHQNIHASGAVRNEAQEVTSAVDVDRLSAAGRAIPLRPGGERPGYEVDGTLLKVRPAEPVAPGATVELDLDWSFPVPESTTGRMGWNGDDLFYMGYWYPRMAVYDDVVGWQTDPFLGRGEFYDGFGRYDVTIEAPEGWVVRATGELRNPEEVLPREVRERLERAGESDTVVHVLGAGEFGAGTATVDAGDGGLRWRFTADTVRDFAFSATRRARWDAARTPVGDRDGDGRTEFSRVEAIWRETAPRWKHVWKYARHSIDFLSRYTGVPYPWPHMTAVEGGGIIGGGMEYPMMTLIGDYTARGDSALYWVTAHELAHMWVPMTLSTDEKRFAWLDEGTTTYNENQARKEFFETDRGEVTDRERYRATALSGHELPMMRRADHYHSGAFGVASYSKPATVLEALKGVVGEETFREAFRTFMREWRFKHPYPWDLFRTFERVSGRDLGWFWRSWYYETWTLDQAVDRVSRDGDRWTVRIRDRGLVPMPVRLRVELADGRTLRREIPVDRWLEGRRTTSVTLRTDGRVVRVEIDPEHHFPDVDRSNDVWRAGDGGGSP